MGEALMVIMRWLHLSSVVALVGGAFYGGFVAARATAVLDPQVRERLWDDMGARYKPLVYAAVAGALLSGIFNLLTHGVHTLTYYIVLGIKLLLVLHVFAVMLLSVQAHAKRSARMMSGAAISGLVIIALSAYLRHNF